MKLKNFLIESAYFLGMLIATWLTVSSCAAHAQANPGYSLRGVLRTAIKADSLWTADTTIQSDSTLDALNPVNGLRVGESAKWENVILTPPLQNLNKQKFGWVTDSIKWVSTDTTFEGDCKCEHDWVYGEPDIAGYGFATYSCLVYHPPGQHCDFNNDVREKICRHCLRSEIEREQWYQHFVAPPKSEFERLKEKQRAKQ